MISYPASCSIHIAVTMAHTGEGVADAFLADLAECAAELVGTKDIKVRFSYFYVSLLLLYHQWLFLCCPLLVLP